MALLLKALAKEAGSTLIIASHDHRLIQHFPTHLMITAPQ
jgi:ABC-type lipoprotein export system ATPase subunit